MYDIPPEDFHAVERHIKRIFDSPSVQARAEAVGRLFVEELDFHPAAAPVNLAAAPDRVILPADVHHVAFLDNAHIVNSVNRSTRKRKDLHGAMGPLKIKGNMDRLLNRPQIPLQNMPSSGHCGHIYEEIHKNTPVCPPDFPSRLPSPRAQPLASRECPLAAQTGTSTHTSSNQTLWHW